MVKPEVRSQNSEFSIRRIAFLLLSLFTIHNSAFPQQPQAQSGQPIYAANAKWVNGVAPGYWPTAGSGLTLNLSAGSAVCDRSAMTYAGGTLTMTASSTNYIYLQMAGTGAPAAPSLSTATTGGSLAAGIYKVEVTYTNPSGESLASAESSITTTGTTSTITITSPAAATNASGWNAYVTAVGGASGSETKQNSSPIGIGTLLLFGSVTSGAALPNSDTTLCAPYFNTTGFTDATVPIAKVVTGASTITTITDVRVGGFLGARIISNVALADRFAGTDAGAKSTACMAALPAAGGVCDARGLQGAQSAAATITVPAYVTLLLGSMTLTSSASPAISVTAGANGASGRVVGLGAATVLNYTGTGYGIDIPATNATAAKPYVGFLTITGTSSGLGGARVSELNQATFDHVAVTGFTNGDGFRNEGANNVDYINCSSRSNLVGYHALSQTFSSATFTPNANVWLGGRIGDNTHYGVWEDGNSLAASVGNQYIGAAIEENGTASSATFVNVYLNWSSLVTFSGVYFENASPSPVPLYHIVLGGTNQTQFTVLKDCSFNTAGYTKVIHSVSSAGVSWLGSTNSTGAGLIDTDDPVSVSVGGNTGTGTGLLGVGTLLPDKRVSAYAGQSDGILLRNTANSNRLSAFLLSTTLNQGQLVLYDSTGTAQVTLTGSGSIQGSTRVFGGVNNITFSATPTFDASLGNTQTITLTGNVTSSTLSNCTAGEQLVFDITEDATGGRTFVAPTTMKGFGALNTAASKHNVQAFYCDGTNAWATSPMQSN